ncbi:hypothetical protein FOL47_010420 [Perkinsus chesapeaki]|uniref:Amino acid transporter transmembrane domain-containing protein n=1 Tax=Perkinsus chesapeaki TaxID=330153 RepID=A0A7J6L441_PERCH|nr:hypothetical protein FOL47_010420 [Perkinsus chesapeaki]
MNMKFLTWLSSGRLSLLGASANLIMACIGVGILALPKVLQQAGWIGGYIILFIASLSSLWMAMHLADACTAKTSSDGVVPTYQQLGEITFGAAPKAPTVPSVGPLSVKLISYLSIIGILSVFVSLILIIIACTAELLSNEDATEYSLLRLTQLGSALGTLMTSFGLTGLIPTVMNNMVDPGKIDLSISLAFLVVTLIYVCITAVGYAAFGASIAEYGDIVSAISNGSDELTDLSYSIIIFILLLCASHFLVLFCPVAADCESLLPSSAHRLWAYLVRALLISVCTVIAAVVPGVVDLIALLGSICGIPNSGIEMINKYGNRAQRIPREFSVNVKVILCEIQFF